MSAPDEVSAPVAGGANVFALLSCVAGLVAAAGMFGFGTPVLAVFAVGAGQVAWGRLQPGQRRSRALALIGLVLGYGLAVWVLVLIVGRYLPAVLSQR